MTEARPVFSCLSTFKVIQRGPLAICSRKGASQSHASLGRVIWFKETLSFPAKPVRVRETANPSPPQTQYSTNAVFVKHTAALRCLRRLSRSCKDRILQHMEENGWQPANQPLGERRGEMNGFRPVRTPHASARPPHIELPHINSISMAFSRIWTAFKAAPFLMLSQTHHRFSVLGLDGSLRIRPT